MKLIKKTLVMALAVFAFGFITYAGIGELDFSQVAEASSLKDSVKSNSTTTLTKTIDNAGNNVVKTARDIAVVALVVLLIWAAYSMFIKKSAEGLADMKGRLGLALVAVAFIFFTEQILGAIFGLLGYKL